MPSVLKFPTRPPKHSRSSRGFSTCGIPLRVCQHWGLPREFVSKSKSSGLDLRALVLQESYTRYSTYGICTAEAARKSTFGPPRYPKIGLKEGLRIPSTVQILYTVLLSACKFRTAENIQNALPCPPAHVDREKGDFCKSLCCTHPRYWLPVHVPTCRWRMSDMYPPRIYT